MVRASPEHPTLGGVDLTASRLSKFLPAGEASQPAAQRLCATTSGVGLRQCGLHTACEPLCRRDVSEFDVRLRSTTVRAANDSVRASLVMHVPTLVVCY